MVRIKLLDETKTLLDGEIQLVMEAIKKQLGIDHHVEFRAYSIASLKKKGNK
jgi:hypothetical protein